MKLRLAKPERETIGSRLREVRRFHQMEQVELAEMAGLSQAIISQYEKGLTEVSLSFLKFLTQKFDVSVEWLLSGQGPSFPEGGPRDLRVKADGGAEGKGKAPFVSVPLVDPQIAARPGAVSPHRILGWQILPREELPVRGDLIALELQAEWVQNMNPIFKPRSRVIVDRSDKNIRPGGYYVVDKERGSRGPRQAHVTAIRRLNLSGSRLWLIEDEPRQSFEFLDLGPKMRLADVVVGRVIWISQNLSAPRRRTASVSR